MKRKIIWSAIVLTLIFSINANAQKPQLTVLSKKVISALKNKDMKTLANYVHPAKGLRFSPYSYVDKDADLVFKKSQVPNLFLQRGKFLWGEYDGSGYPINKGFSLYYKEFIYDRDFARAPEISYEDRIGGGNTVFNVKEIYPKSKYMEYHFPAGKNGNEMGWTSLYLVFEPAGSIAGKWYLVGIVHDEWTS